MEQSTNGTSARPHYGAEEKVKILLREHIKNQVPPTETADRYGIHINDLCNWKKKLFGGAT